jgi:anti-sigma factor RsiW
MAESTDHVTCQEVVELVTEYFNGALTADEAEVFEQHLNFCEGCEWYVDQMRTTVSTVGHIPEEEEVPPEMRDRLLAAFRDWRQS